MYTLMIVDDDELIRKGLQKVIQWEKMGFLVEAIFSDGQSALEYVRLHPVDVILTDIKMPQMSGLELIHQATKYREQIKAVIISGYGEFELAKKALLLKVEDYLLKPLGEDEIEAVFLKLKKTMDREKTDALHENKQKMKAEYSLMKLLEQHVRIQAPFGSDCNRKRYYEMVLIKIREKEGIADSGIQLLSCNGMVNQVLSEFFFCRMEELYSALILPEHLSGTLMHLKREFPKYPGIGHQILIGREVYAEAEVISSYWSAVDLAEEDCVTEVIHYERERSCYKKEWDRVQELKNKMMQNLENGAFKEIDTQVDQLNQLLEHYESKDLYYFYCNIVMKMLKYFDLEHSGTRFFFAHRHFSDTEREYPCSHQLRKNFSQDVDTIRKSLWENSDSMRNLIVTKAKNMIEADYADENLSLAAIANRLNISYGYLSTIFTKSVGYSFKSYLVEVRMEKARNLLLSRNYRIYEIAELVGYRNPRYFTDAFKKYYHYSPVEYISRFRGEII